MGKKVEFYYDFTSPYTYIASTRIEKVCEDNGAELEWKPFLLGGLFVDTGVRAPVDIANKFAYVKRDTRDLAEHYGVEFKFPAVFPLNSVKSMRGAFAASEQGKLTEYTHEMFRLFWTEGWDLGEDGVLCVDNSDICRHVNRRVHLEIRKFGQTHMAIPTAAPSANQAEEGVGVSTKDLQPLTLEPTPGS